MGIAGVAPEAHILPVRTLDNCGGAPVSRVIDAFKAAGDSAEVDIVTGSFGTNPWVPANDGAIYRGLFEQVFARYPGKLFVVAAGNEGNDNDALPVYPCSAQAANLICVGMSDSADSPACWGNVGEHSVDLFAPGVSIYSTVRGVLGYTQRSGTSMSAPMVAGAAALVLERSPEFDPETIKDVLVLSVDPKVGMGGTALNPARPAERGTRARGARRARRRAGQAVGQLRPRPRQRARRGRRMPRRARRRPPRRLPGYRRRRPARPRRQLREGPEPRAGRPRSRRRRRPLRLHAARGRSRRRRGAARGRRLPDRAGRSRERLLVRGRRPGSESRRVGPRRPRPPRVRGLRRGSSRSGSRSRRRVAPPGGRAGRRRR